MSSETGLQHIRRHPIDIAYSRTGSTVSVRGVDLWATPLPWESAIVGFSIPWLPDFLSNQRFQDPDRAAALVKFLASWQLNIANLWHAQNAAFSLRFEWVPARSTIEAAMLVRVTAQSTELLAEVQKINSALSAIWNSNNLEAVPLDGSRLSELLAPRFSQSIVEVRQKEEIFTFRTPKGPVDAYAVLPFAFPTGDFIDLLEALRSCPHPVLVNLHLQPTKLSPAEESSLEQAVAYAKNAIEIKYDGRTIKYDLKNPQAETVYRIYSALQKRLHEPFLVLGQVCATDARDADSVADRLGRDIVQRNTGSIEAHADEIPLGFERVTMGPHAARAARAILEQLWFVPCLPSKASQGKERLRYLVDSRGAAAAFRFPVPTNIGLPSMQVRKARPGQEPVHRKSETDDQILLGAHVSGKGIYLPVKNIPRHILICGTPGSGKTNTSLNILHQLWAKHRIPFWVFEPPKTEYRGLLKQPGFEEALVFTVGNESIAPFRMNPLELLPNISVEEHIANLKVCFEAAMPQLDDGGALVGMFLDEAIRKAYKNKRWRFTDTGSAGLEFPVLHDLLEIISENLKTYSGEVRDNLEASMKNRLNLLLRGSKGRMFNVDRGIPMDDLMKRPIIFELQPMGSDAPLMLMFLLTFLQEFASHRPLTNPLGVEHVTLVEEAHVVMSSGDSAKKGQGASSKVADAFERMLAELRSSGEGVMIAEQSPTKLVKGAIDLTNLKIVHRLASTDEVAAVGGAMIGQKEQLETFQRLQVGEAAFFMEGMEGLGFMSVPNFKGLSGFPDKLEPSTVKAEMDTYYQENPQVCKPFYGCRFCKANQDYRASIDQAVRRSERLEEARQKLEDGDVSVIGDWLEIADAAGAHGQKEAAWCAYVQTMDLLDEDYILMPAHRKFFEKDFVIYQESHDERNSI